MPDGTRQSCDCARLSKTCCGWRTLSISWPPRWPRSRPRHARRCAIATSPVRSAKLKQRCSICAGSLPTPSIENRTGANKRVADADSMLAQAEQSFGTLTGTLAELTAQRSQLEAAVRTHGGRLAKLDSEIASVSAELRQLADNDNGTVDLAALSSMVDQAQAAVADAEAAALRAEVAHSAARQALDMARKPLAEAERRGQRLDTEAKTLAKLL